MQIAGICENEKCSLLPASSDSLGDVTPVLFIHRIALSVSPPNVKHLNKTISHPNPAANNSQGRLQ